MGKTYFTEIPTPLTKTGPYRFIKRFINHLEKTLRPKVIKEVATMCFDGEEEAEWWTGHFYSSIRTEDINQCYIGFESELIGIPKKHNPTGHYIIVNKKDVVFEDRSYCLIKKPPPQFVSPNHILEQELWRILADIQRHFDSAPLSITAHNHQYTVSIILEEETFQEHGPTIEIAIARIALMLGIIPKTTKAIIDLAERDWDHRERWPYPLVPEEVTCDMHYVKS